jgi:hypothetical protein
MMEMLSSLEASTFSTWVRESPSVWAYPTILTLHTVGLGVLVGANWMVDLRVLGVARAIPLAVLSRAFTFMWVGFWVNAISGAMLFAADPITKGTTAVFMWKLGIIAVGVVMIIALKKKLYGPASTMDAAGLGVKVMAAVSLTLWVAAIGTGRWMAYAAQGGQQ